MGDQAKKNRQAALRPHKFVSVLQEHGTNCKLVRGFIGKSRDECNIRVYLDIELKRFVEIPEEAILHVEDERERLGASTSIVLWVNEKASIQHFGSWFASEDPTTMATGEEGGGDPTTMATGEESLGPYNPLDEIVNPFGNY